MVVYNSFINFNYILNYYLVINEMVINFKGYVFIRDIRMKKIKDYFDLIIIFDLCIQVKIIVQIVEKGEIKDLYKNLILIFEIEIFYVFYIQVVFWRSLSKLGLKE